MTTPADIKWSAYRSWEGPWFRGSAWLKLPKDPSPAFKRVYISSATEGGFNSINAYDRCTISVGIMQACETPWFLTSQLTGAIAERSPKLLRPLAPALAASKADFTKTARGRWRFFFKDDRGEVDAGAEQKQLFLLNSDGTKGSWDAKSKAHAKLWAASFANMLVQPEAKDVQIEWAAKRITLYAMKDAKKVLFDKAKDDGWVGAMRAAYLSFALNIPTVAQKTFMAALQDAPGKKWSPEWCVHILRGMTFGSGVSLWPHRYEAIRKNLERLYGVDLPDGSDDLKAWKASQGLQEAPDEAIYDEGLVSKGKEPTFTTPREVQSFLISMGHDLGPAGADGVLGRKSRDAIRTFQSLSQLGLVADGIVGPQTRVAMLEAWRAGVCI